MRGVAAVGAAVAGCVRPPQPASIAQVAAAAKMQLPPDRFWAFHQKLMGNRGQVGKAQALAESSLKPVALLLCRDLMWEE